MVKALVAQNAALRKHMREPARKSEERVDDASVPPRPALPEALGWPRAAAEPTEEEFELEK